MSRFSKVFALLCVPVLILSFCGLAMAGKDDNKTDLPDTRPASGLQPSHDTCAGAINVGAGGFWNDDTSTANDDYNPKDSILGTSCTSAFGYYAEGPDVVYVVNLGAGQKVKATMTPTNPTYWDASIYLITDCDDPVNSCVAGDDSGNPEEIIYCSQDGGTYYIICDGYSDGSYGEFTLDVTVDDCVEEGCCLRYTEIFDFNYTTPYDTVGCGGGYDVWQWGPAPEAPDVDCNYGAVTNVLGTIIGGNYLSYSGQIAYIGPVAITPESWCLELCHFYNIEGTWDGGNVKVSTDGGATWTLIYPLAGYPRTCNTSPRCVPSEDSFGGNSSTFIRDCFDLTPYMDQSVLVGFFFGSDGSVQYDGWYIKWAKFGTDATVAEPTGWGTIKSMMK